MKTLTLLLMVLSLTAYGQMVQDQSQQAIGQSIAGDADPFLPPIDSLVGASPSFTVVSDFNADKIPDLAVVSGVGMSRTVVVLTGMGDGTFQPWATIELPRYRSSSQPMAAGDINNDGWVDLVMNTGEVFLNQRDGRFALTTQLIGPDWDTVAIGDLDADGNADVALSHTYGLWIYWGEGDGTFDQRAEFTLSGVGTALEFADYTNDGIPDVFKLCGNRGLDSYIIVGSQTRQLRLVRTSWILGEAYAFAAGDFDNDGNRDVAFQFVRPPSQSGVRVALGRGDASFAQGELYPFSETGTKAGDVSNDGTLDLIGAGFFNVGAGDGTFGPAIRFASGSFSGFEVGDFNRDGLLDIVLVNSAAGTVSVYLNAGTRK